jgi:hemerythrin
VQITEDIRSFLESTHLFGEGVSASALLSIVGKVKPLTLASGKTVTGHDLEVFNIIISGTVERWLGDKVIETMHAGDYFGEEWSVFKVPCLFHFRVPEETKVYQVSGDAVSNIPGVRWRLFEGYQDRVSQVMRGNKKSNINSWRENFRINISQMDVHHKRLFEIANSIAETLHFNNESGLLAKSFETLIDYTHSHFVAEEALMVRYDYPECASHSNLHRVLEQQVAEYYENISKGMIPKKAEFQQFMKGWLMHHILEEDPKYSTFLNARGVY